MERIKTREEIVRTFWEQRNDPSWLFFHLWLEWIRLNDEGCQDAGYMLYIKYALEAMRLGDIAQLKRQLLKLGDYCKIELIEDDEMINEL